MVKLGELLKNVKPETIVQKSISVGDVLYSKMDLTSGIIPKHGDTFRHKFFIVLGFDSEGNIYGGLIINSKINQNIPPVYRLYHMPISASKYNFLKYDSFVDCAQLKTIKLEDYFKWSYVGKIEKNDLDLMINTIKDSPLEKKGNLRRFGLQ